MYFILKESCSLFFSTKPLIKILPIRTLIIITFSYIVLLPNNIIISDIFKDYIDLRIILVFPFYNKNLS